MPSADPINGQGTSLLTLAYSYGTGTNGTAGERDKGALLEKLEDEEREVV
jgi:hypothetical protein